MTALSLDEEIEIYQFAQGVSSDAALLEQFRQFDKRKQQHRFVHFYCQVCENKFMDSDIEQALTNCSLTATDALYSYLNLHRLTTGSTNAICIPHSENPPEDRLDKAYKLLLHLFKAAYHRRFASEKNNPTNWHYRDLSNKEVVQEIRASHQAWVEKIYANPSFRSEFVTLAKLCHEVDTLFRAKQQQAETTPERQTAFTFLTYNELLTEIDKKFDDTKLWNAIGTLRHSVEKGLVAHYRLDTEKTRKLVSDVIEQHLRETYDSGLF
jgi:hypothetical protein